MSFGYALALGIGSFMGTDKDIEVASRALGASRDTPEQQEATTGAAERKEERPADGSQKAPGTTSPSAKGGGKARRNDLRQLRLDRMMSKAELARRAGVSTLTIDRIERGLSCRMDTKRKILEALGLTPQDRVKVFGEDE
jgi:DNA-binding XRE family transcriptional regulator